MLSLNLTDEAEKDVRFTPASPPSAAPAAADDDDNIYTYTLMSSCV